ncbi:MAG: hypothetical protein DRJ96_08095 [Thermoprotei archaeon]|nr:MFS transporter [Thermoproteales archaeon]RLE95687.1 MAG: hypothetical protein DRJ96_08095 [Thermoprotei archaeon]
MRGRLRALATSSFTAFVGTAAFRVSIPAVAYYVREELSGAMAEVGLLTSAFFTARAAAALLAGRALEAGARTALLASLCFAVNAAVAQLYMLSSTWLAASLLKLVQGILNGLAWVSIQYALGLSVEARLRGRAYSVYFAMGSLGSMMGNVIYSILGEGGMWKALTASSLLFVATAVTAAMVPEPPAARKVKAKRSSPPPATGVGGLNIQVLTAIASIRAASALIGGDLIYVYLREACGASRQAVALVVGLCDVAGIAASFAISWVADRGRDLAAMALASVSALSGGVLFAVRSPLTLLAGYALFAIGARSLTPLTRRVATTYAEMKGMAVGAVNAVGNFSTALSSPLIGGLLDVLDYQTVNVAGVEILIAMAVIDLVIAAGACIPLTLLAKLGSSRPASREYASRRSGALST